MLPTRRDFLAIAAACVSATPLSATSSVQCDQESPYLGRSLHEWMDSLGKQDIESSHAVDALAAYGRPAMLAAFQRSFHTSCEISEQRLKRVLRIVACRDLGVIDDLLRVSADDPWRAQVCLGLIAPLVDCSSTVVRAIQKEAAQSDLPGQCCYYSELLLNAGVPVSLSSIEPSVLEFEDDFESEELSFREDLVQLMNVLLRADGSGSLKASLFNRISRLLGRSNDDESAAFVANLTQCGEWGYEALVGYAVSTLRETSRLACRLLSESAEKVFPIVRSLGLSQETDRRIAAVRILSHCLEVPSDLLELARRDLDHPDPGVCGLAALTLLKQQVDQDRAHAVIAGTLRRPELRYRRWIMEGLAGFAGPVDAVDRRLMKMLTDDDEDVRYYAMRRVRQLRYNSSEMIQVIGKIWQDRTKADALQRAEAFEYLVELGEAALPIAFKGLAGSNRQPRYELISLFGRLGPQAISAAPALAACWGFGDTWKRVAILQSLYSMKAYSQLWPLVVEALNGDDPDLICIAAAALANARRSDFIVLWPILKKGLRSHDCDIQSATACAVSSHGAEVTDELLELLRSDDPYARLGATKVLRRCGIDSGKVAEALRRAEGDQDLAVRRSASLQLVA